MIGAIIRIAMLVGKYGSRAVQWVWGHVGQILDWLNAGQAIDWIVEKIRQILGLR